MGQQQLLLVLIGTIVVGIAVAIGIDLFDTYLEGANRDAVVGDLQNLSGSALNYYHRSKYMGGGGGSFDGIKMSSLTSQPQNDNGYYLLFDIQPQQLIIYGVGRAISASDSARAKAIVTRDGIAISQMN